MENFETILHRIRTIRPTDQEKQRTRAVVLDFMADHPHHERSLLSHVTMRIHQYAAISVMLLFLTIIAGVAFVSESAIPGDLTYVIKIKVNEQVRDAVTVSEEDQLSWDITKAERRMAEAEQLATENGF